MAIDITATKPAKQPGNPSFATNGGTRVEPTLGQKQTGWTNAQRPPFNVFNWILGFLADWTKYAEDATDELDAGKLSRKGTGASTPQGMIGTLTSERDALDDCGASASRWATVWTYILNVSLEILLSATALITATRITLDLSADVPTTPRTRSLTSNNMCRAKYVGTFNSGAGTFSIDDGYNVGTITLHTGTKKYLRFTFAADMADTNYLVFATEDSAIGSNVFLQLVSGSRTTHQFDVRAIDPTTGSEVDMLSVQKLMVLVF